MLCSRCKKELDHELAEKSRILDEIFWKFYPGEEMDERWHECYECHGRLSRRIRRFVSNLFDPIWWEYHAWYDFQRVVLHRKFWRNE